LTTSHAWEPVALLFLGAVGEDVMTDNTLNTGPEVNSRCREFLVHHGFMSKRPSSTSVFLRKVREQDAGPAHCSPSFVVGAVLLAPAGLLRHELFLDKLANCFAENPQFVIHPRGLVRNSRHLDPFQETAT